MTLLDAPGLGVRQGDDRRLARLARQEAHLAEEIGRLERRDAARRPAVHGHANLDVALREDVKVMALGPLDDEGLPCRKGRERDRARESFALLRRQGREDGHLLEQGAPSAAIGVDGPGAALGVIGREDDVADRDRDIEAGAPEREPDPRPHDRIRRVGAEHVREPVAHRETRGALREVDEEALGRGLAIDTRNRVAPERLFHARDHLRWRRVRVHVEPNPAALAFPGPDPAAAQEDRVLHEEGVGHHGEVAVARLDRRLAPSDLPDEPRRVAVRHPVADLHGPVELERETGHDVSERVLQGPADDRREDGRRRDDPDDLDTPGRQHRERRGDAAGRDREVAEDARRSHLHEREEDVEEQRSRERNGGDRGDRAPREIEGGRRSRQADLGGEMGGRVNDEAQDTEEHDPEHAAPLAAVRQRHEERGGAEREGVPEDGVGQEGL